MKKKPICITNSHGTMRWTLNGHLHREDGPAIEYSDGFKEWLLNGKWYATEESYWREIFNRGLITEKDLFLKLL